MFKVEFNSTLDVFSFVEQFGSVAGLWKMGAINKESLEHVDHAVKLSNCGQKDVVLKTLSDTYCDNNGHRLVEVVSSDISEELNVNSLYILTGSCYGEHKESFVEYIEDMDVSISTKLLIELMGQRALMHRANKLFGKIRY